MAARLEQLAVLCAFAHLSLERPVRRRELPERLVPRVQRARDIRCRRRHRRARRGLGSSLGGRCGGRGGGGRGGRGRRSRCGGRGSRSGGCRGRSGGGRSRSSGHGGRGHVLRTHASAAKELVNIVVVAASFVVIGQQTPRGSRHVEQR